MKAKIVKCSNSAYWYNDKIGEEYKVTQNDKFTQTLLINTGDKKLAVMKDDVEFLD